MPTTPLPRLAAQTPATALEALPVQNGVYEIEIAGSTFTYRISTITHARTEALVGKRVVSRMNGDGSWTMFAFVTQAGSLKVWQRFSADGHLDYVRSARTLLEILNAVHAEPDSYRHYGRRVAGMIDWVTLDSDIAVSFTIVCRVCNGRVTGANTSLCNRHSTARSTSFSEPPFSTVGEVIFDANTDTLVPPTVPVAITERLARSEVNARNIR